MKKLITPEDRIFVAGHRGMAGSAICRALQRAGYSRILTATRRELDLLNGQEAFQMHANTKNTSYSKMLKRRNSVRDGNSVGSLLGFHLGLYQHCMAHDQYLRCK